MSWHIPLNILLYREVLILEKIDSNELLDEVEKEVLGLQRQTKHVLQFIY